MVQVEVCQFFHCLIMKMGGFILFLLQAAPSQSLPQHLHLPQPCCLSLMLPTQQDGLQIENQRFEEAGKSFFQLWAPSFTACETLVDLSDVLDRCCKDWLSKARALDKNEEPTKGKKTQERSKNRRRTQSRQMQRARKKRSRQEEAKRIQRLFYIYPKRAVREVLGERSPPYTGTFESAEEFLKSTYEGQQGQRTRVEEREHFMNLVSGQCLTKNRSAALNRPPSKEEIEPKLRRATNTAPGADGLEYRHLRALDPQALLLEKIFEAVWRLGIPDSWRCCRTIPIYKKGSTDDFSNFRPISLISTTYKIFSSVLNQRLCHIASSLGWLSPEQKGFLPGVQGIQEHTHVLQTAVEEAKPKRKGLSNCFYRHEECFWLCSPPFPLRVS